MWYGSYFYATTSVFYFILVTTNVDDNIFIHLQCSTRHWQTYFGLWFIVKWVLDIGYAKSSTLHFSISFSTHRTKCALNHSYNEAMTLRSIQWALNNPIALQSSKRKKEENMQNKTNRNHHYHFPISFAIWFYRFVITLFFFSHLMFDAYTHQQNMFVYWLIPAHKPTRIHYDAAIIQMLSKHRNATNEFQFVFLSFVNRFLCECIFVSFICRVPSDFANDSSLVCRAHSSALPMCNHRWANESSVMVGLHACNSVCMQFGWLLVENLNFMCNWLWA